MTITYAHYCNWRCPCRSWPDDEDAALVNVKLMTCDYCHEQYLDAYVGYSSTVIHICCGNKDCVIKRLHETNGNHIKHRNNVDKSSTNVIQSNDITQEGDL